MAEKTAIFKQLLTNLPPLDGTDLENAYISKQVLVKVDHANGEGKDLNLGVFFIPWDGEPYITFSSWWRSETMKYTEENFECITWADLPKENLSEKIAND